MFSLVLKVLIDVLMMSAMLHNYIIHYLGLAALQMAGDQQPLRVMSMAA